MTVARSGRSCEVWIDKHGLGSVGRSSSFEFETCQPVNRWKKLSDKLRELREESQTNIYRIIYCFVSGRSILLLHGFQKKTQRTPRGEIEIAERRLTRFLERESGETHDSGGQARPRT